MLASSIAGGRAVHGPISRQFFAPGCSISAHSIGTFLGAQGAKKGDLSKFIEEAVRWRVFHRTVQSIKERNADTDPEELQRIISEAVSEVRADRSVKKRVNKA